MRISYWSSDVGSSDLQSRPTPPSVRCLRHPDQCWPQQPVADHVTGLDFLHDRPRRGVGAGHFEHRLMAIGIERFAERDDLADAVALEHRVEFARGRLQPRDERSEEHTSELQSLMRIPYAGFLMKTKK